MIKAEKLDLIPHKIQIYNDNIAEKSKVYIKNYWKIVSKVWKEPILLDRDGDILSNKLLVANNFGSMCGGFNWDYNLSDLNREYKKVLSFR